MKKFVIPAVSVLILAFLIAGCGKTSAPTTQGNNTGGGACTKVEMAATTFVQSTCTIKVGDSLQFVDPSGTGGFHILCLGKNQTCTADPNGPTELNTSGGVTFQAGDTKSYTFSKAGTFAVTCTVHPNMDVTVTVQ